MPRSQFSAPYDALLELLRERRTAAGITQSALARRLRMTQSMISKIESGERRLDVVELRAVCRAIGVPLPALIQEWERRLG